MGEALLATMRGAGRDARAPRCGVLGWLLRRHDGFALDLVDAAAEVPFDEIAWSQQITLEWLEEGDEEE